MIRDITDPDIVEITVEGKSLLVRLSSRIYMEEVAQLRMILIERIEKGDKNLIIDFGRTDYIDSFGLGVFVDLRKMAMKNGGGVVIKGLHGAVKELFDLTRLTKVFEIQ